MQDPRRIQAIIGIAGQTVTMKRSGVADLVVKASVAGYQPHELVGGIQQGDRKVFIAESDLSDASWPSPPRKGDQIVISGKTAMVQAVDTRSLGENVALHVVTVRG